MKWQKVDLYSRLKTRIDRVQSNTLQSVSYKSNRRGLKLLKMTPACILLLAALTSLSAQAALVQHLDATDSGSVTGSPVTYWADLSGYGNDAIPSVGNVYYPSTSLSESGLAGLDLGLSRNSLDLFDAAASDSWLNQAANPNGFCVLVAFKCDALVSNWNDLIGNSTLTGSGFGLRYSLDGVMQAYLDGTINKGGEAVAAGDTIVYAFNYNASLGEYSFWDSKNGSSLTGVKAAADFSEARSVTLGSTSGITRFVDGMVGEVKIFDSALSATEFASERDALVSKWIGAGPISGWRVISEDTNYPTDDTIVAFCEVTDPVYNLPADTVNTDCTAAFQAALDDASTEAHGGTVFVPAGEYRIEGTLSFSDNVILRGRWSEITATNEASGTILALYNTGTDPIINLSANGCGVRDLTFWHPEQIPHATSPTVYPFVIYGYGSQTTVENITLVNAYNGIDMSRSYMCCVRGVYGSPLNTGLTADASAAVSRFDSLHFSPETWAWSGLYNSPTSPSDAHADYMMNYGTAVDIREMDGFYFLFSSFSGYNKGVVLRAGVSTDDPWGSMAYISSINCRTAMVVEEAKWIKMVGCTLQGSEVGITGANDSSIALIMNGCTVSGGIHSVALVNGSAHLVNCALTGPTSAMDPASIIESSNATFVPEFNNVYDKVRKPTQTDLFNVKDYGAVGDGITDDTLAIKQAVADADANGGGIVFVPNGKYLMTENVDLGVGVELRGNSGGRHLAVEREELGSLIYIKIGKNQPNGAPFITLGDYSGLRGISFFYPEQQYTDDNAYDPYPYMVRGNGYKNYIIDCSAGNPYQAAEFNGDDHLVEYTFFGGMKSTYRANNCSGGRIQNCHVKPGFWRDSGLPGNPLENTNMGPYKWDIGEDLQVIYLNGCTDYSIMGIFNHASHDLVTVDNSSGQSMMVAAEQVQHGITVKNGSKPFDFIMTGATVNNIGDYTGQYGIKTLSDYTGVARFFTSYHWGTSEEALASEGGNLYLQQCDVGGFKRKGAMNFRCGTDGAMTLESCTADVFFGIDNEGSLTMTDCSFERGLMNEDYQTYAPGNHVDNVAVVADLNEDPPQAFGLELDMSNVEMVEAAQETIASLYPTEGDSRRNMAARLTSGYGYELDVTDPEFSDGAKNNIRFEILVMVSNTTATIKTYYDNGGAELKLANTTSVDATEVNIKWQTIWVYAPDAVLGAADNVDIRIETTDPSATILDMVAVFTSDLPVADTIPPAAPTGLSATAGDGSVSLGWNVNTEPDLSLYGIYRADSPTGDLINIQDVGVNSYNDPDVVNGTTYYYVVTAMDGAGNESDPSIEVSATPSGIVEDTEPPTPNPSEWVSVSAVSATAIEMQAVIAEDPSGVEYSFYGLTNGVSAFWSGWITNSTYTAINLSPATEYSVSVSTRDGLGNGGSWSVAEAVTTFDEAVAWSTLTEDDFESGMGHWVDGGDDVALSGDYAIGTQCLDLQDNSGDASSVWLANSLDLSSYSELKVEFTYMPISMDNTKEDFWVLFSDDGGASWTTVKAFVLGVDFDNGTRETPVVIIDSGSYNFTSNVKIRFQCDASANQDDIYIDDIRITAR